MTTIETSRSRKDQHLDLCIAHDVGFRDKTTLLEEVELVHQALPELAWSDLDLGTLAMGRHLDAPLLIAAMTGGNPRSEAINRDLAEVAQELRIGFALGSQRSMLLDGVSTGFLVRDLAPDILLLGNIGLTQAREASTESLAGLLERSGADALCVHMNPAMEIMQPGGDSDFRGGLETLARLRADLGRPIIAKETGCGISRGVGLRLREAGLRWVDVSGAGGTSWVRVEGHRAEGGQATAARLFSEWGIPTAASLVQLEGLGLQRIATGGIMTGLDAARALALGASLVGIARPVLRAHAQGGFLGVREYLVQVIHELKVAMLITGSRRPVDLIHAPRVLGARLERWIPREGERM